MKFVLSLLIAFASTTVMADNTTTGDKNNVNICQPKIIVKSCGNCCALKAKTKTVTKVVEKIVDRPVVVEKTVEKVVEKKVTRRNHVSLILGYGAKGNLVETRESNPTRTVVVSENGPVVGVQYLREISSGEKSSLDLLIQAQTNRTISVGIGFGF